MHLGGDTCTKAKIYRMERLSSHYGIFRRWNDWTCIVSPQCLFLVGQPSCSSGISNCSRAASWTRACCPTANHLTSLLLSHYKDKTTSNHAPSCTPANVSYTWTLIYQHQLFRCAVRLIPHLWLLNFNL
jgi:hypothetical protein